MFRRPSSNTYDNIATARATRHNAAETYDANTSSDAANVKT
jgi:hypothetical protein